MSSRTPATPGILQDTCQLPFYFLKIRQIDILLAARTVT